MTESVTTLLYWLTNLTLLAGATWGLWRRAPLANRWAKWLFAVALAVRLAGGVGVGLFYQHQFADTAQPGGDTFSMHRLAAGLNRWAHRQPAAYVRLLLTADRPPAAQLPDVFRPRPNSPVAPYTSAFFLRSSNSWFLARLLSVLYFLTGRDYWLSGLWLSWLAFAAGWLLTREFARLVPAATWATALGALLWPSVVFYGAGVTKDCVVLTALGLFAAAALRLTFPLDSAKRSRWQWVALLVISSWLFWRIKFFVAAVAFVAFGALWLTTRLQRRWPQVRSWQLYAGTALVLAPVSRLLHRAFRPEYLLHHLPLNQHELQARSVGQPQLALPLEPSLWSFLRYAPEAAVGVFVRPWLWEGAGLRWRVVGLENAALLVLLGWALVQWWRRGHSFRLPLLAGSLLVFVVVVSIMLGLSTPNLGSLHRYRSVVLPFSIFLLGWLGSGVRSRKYGVGSTE